MLYDDQAARFDERAGVPDDAVAAIARAVADIARLAAGDTLLEVGAGTGGVSAGLIALPVRYVGFDRSPAMIEVFRGRAEAAEATPELHVSDGNARWPVDDGAVAAIFCSRALHHLAPEHVASEARRVTRAPAGTLLVGRVRRPPDSVKSLMRREMRRLLPDEGVAGRSADSAAETVFALLEGGGAERLDTVVAARWRVRHAPADSLASWRGKAGLAGVDLSPDAKARVLDRLRAVAEARYGDLSVPLEQEESYEIAAIRVHMA